MAVWTKYYFQEMPSQQLEQLRNKKQETKKKIADFQVKSTEPHFLGKFFGIRRHHRFNFSSSGEFFAPNFVDQKQCIDPFSLSLSWEGRQPLLEQTEQLFRDRFEARNTNDRNIHRIGVVGGFPGIGKSRTLVELIDPIQSWHQLGWTVPVIISYNNGNPPTPDREMKPSVAFALRILYFALLARKIVHTESGDCRLTFEKFASTMPRDIRDKLTPQAAIEILVLIATALFNSSDGIVYLAVDEVNYLLDPGYKGETIKRTFLKETMIAFGELLLSGAVFVFGIVAGTTVLPIEKIFSESSHPIRKFPIGMLSYRQCQALIEKLEDQEPAIWSGWKTCRAFKTLVADFASIPRKLDMLLRSVRKQIQTFGERNIHSLDFQDMYHELQASVSVDKALIPYASPLIAAAILCTPVDRRAPVLNDLESMTYGALEEAGFIVLATDIHESNVVQLPYSLFRKLVACLKGSDALTLALRKACILTDMKRSEEETNSWQSFEDLFANIEAIREMLLAREAEDKAISLNEFYCCTHPTCSAVDDLLEFDLRTDCGVKVLNNRFPTDLPDLQGTTLVGFDNGGSQVNANSSIVKNEPGAPFDTFTVRRTIDGGHILVCGQQKCYQAGEVDIHTILSEAEKVSARLENLTYVLVIVATRIRVDCFDRIPDNCVIMSGDSLERFFGPVFSGRAILLISSTQVEMNTASFMELRTVPGIGDKLATRIINIRKVQHFKSWNDAKDRVSRLPLSSEPHWTF